MRVKAVDIIKCSLPHSACVVHMNDQCGDLLTINDLIIFRHEIMGEGTDLSERINAYVVRDGAQCCLVGCLPTRLLQYKERFNGKAAVVVEDLRVSESKAKRARSEQNGGIVKAMLIHEIELTCRNT